MGEFCGHFVGQKRVISVFDAGKASDGEFFENKNCSEIVAGQFFRSPRFGVGRRGSPRFVPISPFSSDLLRFALLVFRNIPICSVFLPICSDLFSEQITTNQGNTFLPTPFANPRFLSRDMILYLSRPTWFALAHK